MKDLGWLYGISPPLLPLCFMRNASNVGPLPKHRPSKLQLRVRVLPDGPLTPHLPDPLHLHTKDTQITDAFAIGSILVHTGFVVIPMWMYEGPSRAHSSAASLSRG